MMTALASLDDKGSTSKENLHLLIACTIPFYKEFDKKK